MLTEYHDDDENAFLDEGVLVGHDVRVIQLPKEISLKKEKGKSNSWILLL